MNILSVWVEFGPLLAEILGRTVAPSAFRSWRPGDHPVFVADISKAARDFGWEQQVNVVEGFTRDSSLGTAKHHAVCMILLWQDWALKGQYET